jgi:eukaryotic-like serine/threonine-protein kinase
VSLTAGTRLGPYEIVAPLGAGGMGEVYRARDSKLQRDVALKVLPDEFARDPDCMARFRREAELLASLNHPHIAQIYAVEENALVMELVDGETLKVPLPLDEALLIAGQIADALEAADVKDRTSRPESATCNFFGVVPKITFSETANSLQRAVIVSFIPVDSK